MRWTQLTLCALLLSINCVAGAQQFNADNQWVAPYGVGTVAATTGEAHSDPQYRFEVRWESPKLIIATTFSEAISHSFQALEFGQEHAGLIDR